MNADFVFHEEISGPGLWWLPSNEEHRVAGDFTYSPDSGIRVKLYGSLHPEPALAITDDLDLELVLGTVKIGKRNLPITLNRCLEVSSSIALVGWGVNHSELHARIAFAGVHFTTIDDLVFDEMLFSANGLDAWVSLSGFEFTQEPNAVIVKQQEVDPIAIFERDGLSIRLQVINAGLSRQMVQKEVVLSQRTFFNLKWTTHVTFHEAIRVASKLSDFLTLGTGELAAPLQITMFSQNALVETQGGSSYRERVQVLYQPNVRSAVKEPLPPLMTFTFAQERNRLPDLLGKWFDNAQELKPVHDLYFGTIRQNSIYPSQRFLNAVQALESFHRRTSPPAQQDLESARQRVDRIKQATNELNRRDRDWLDWKLRYPLESSLQQRLEEIESELAHLLPELFKSGQLPRLIAVTRNYLTHYDASLETEAVTDGPGLYRLSEKVLLVVYVCLLSRLFEEQELNTLVQRDPIQRRIGWLIDQD
jgi:ApeA N-terminal domain 1